MSFLGWLKGKFSRRQMTLALYRSGMQKAKKDDHAGAISDYTASIGASDIPADVKAMALYNRALSYSHIDEIDKAEKDLEAVLKLPGAPEKIKVAASQRQQRLRRRADADPTR